jgi:hypothetical protein
MSIDTPIMIEDFGIHFDELTSTQSKSVERPQPVYAAGEGFFTRDDEATGVVTTPGDLRKTSTGWGLVLDNDSDWESPTHIKILNPNGIGVYMSFYPWSDSIEAYVPDKIQPGTGRVLSYAPLQFPSGIQVLMPDLATSKAARAKQDEQASNEAALYRLAHCSPDFI